MIIVYSGNHARHAPAAEFERGRLAPYRETTSRLARILDEFRRRGLGRLVEPSDHGLEPIRAVHSDLYIEHIRTAYAAWLEAGGNPDGVFPDTWAVRSFANVGRAKGDGTDAGSSHPAFASGILGKAGFFAADSTAVIVDGTYAAAYEAAQVALTAADIALNAEEGDGAAIPAAFALCRPPGHHAHSDLAAGYCFFNNAAIATRYIQSQKGIRRVAILDVDYHHGNGTQHIFYSQRDPLYVSLHAFPEYPYFWGSAGEVGEGEGRGFNVNVPLAHGITAKQYLEELEKSIQTHIIPYEPEVVVVSLGVDTFANDPVGGLIFLETETYISVGAAVARIGKPTLFIMEGGYDEGAIGENVCNVLQGFETYGR